MAIVWNLQRGQGGKEQKRQKPKIPEPTIKRDMALLISCSGSLFLKTGVKYSRDFVPSTQGSVQPGARSVGVKSFLNPFNEPILKEAIKEPVAFFGGAFAGLLRLDLNEEPLKDWISRSVEASGVTVEDIEAGNPQEEEAAPQQIEIE